MESLGNGQSFSLIASEVSSDVFGCQMSLWNVSATIILESKIGSNEPFNVFGCQMSLWNASETSTLEV